MISIRDFIAYDLPTKKVLNLFCAKMRVRVRSGRQEFVSSTVKVGNRGETVDPEGPPVSCTQWEDDFSRLELNDDELFEVEIEKRGFLGWYKCIRRTGQTTIRKIREESSTDDSNQPQLSLPLYDGPSIGHPGHEQSIVMGNITFMSEYVNEGSLSESASSSAA